MRWHRPYSCTKAGERGLATRTRQVMDEEADARTINAQPWEPSPGMVKRAVSQLPVFLRRPRQARGRAAVPRLHCCGHQNGSDSARSRPKAAGAIPLPSTSPFNRETVTAHRRLLSRLCTRCGRRGRRRALADQGGACTALFVALRSDDTLFGTLSSTVRRCGRSPTSRSRC